MAHVHESWHLRKETINTNFIGSFNLLEACRSLPEFPKVLLIGSADCYGIVPESEQPISESRLFSPSSPYAVSKIAQEVLGIQYAIGEHFPVYLSRSFNHTGPRQKDTFVCPAFARQIALAEQQPDAPKIAVGNLVAKRDFSDVRDVVRAYKTILEQGKPGEPYNVCSGKAYSIEEILQMMISISGKKLETIIDRNKFRPVDMKLLLGSHQKLTQDTGWKPHYDIRTTLSDLLNYWREKIKIEEPVS
jgi:GDP-4-dehydro-6-deoxy-D-mannose reductase